MKSKYKKIIACVLPLIALLALAAFRVVNIAKATLYPDFSSVAFEVLLAGGLPSIVYWILLTVYFKTKKISSKRIVGVISAVTMTVLLCVTGYVFLVGSNEKSITTDINNYLALDEGSPVHNSSCDELLPVEVPENAQNPVYDYYCEFSLFSGSYVYAEWTLPENEYLEEKQRIADSADEYKLEYFKYDNQDVYALDAPRDIAQFSFSDKDCRVSYLISAGVVIDNLWEKQLSE